MAGSGTEACMSITPFSANFDSDSTAPSFGNLLLEVGARVWDATHNESVPAFTLSIPWMSAKKMDNFIRKAVADAIFAQNGLIIDPDDIYFPMVN